jgi:hypothetical protein
LRLESRIFPDESPEGAPKARRQYEFAHGLVAFSELRDDLVNGLGLELAGT